MATRFGYEVMTVDGGDAAVAAVTAPDARIDCMVLDLVMPDLDGYGVLARMRDAGVNMPVIVQTAHGGIDKVVSAMRAGAIDFVVKPVGAERLQVSLRNALSASALETEFQRLKRSRAGTLSFKDIVTRNARMQQVLRTAEKAAASQIPVLIEGESGVGKELIARAIHGSGERRAKPFVAVNCGAIPENLVESTLFGHEKGSFTGATEKHTRQVRRGFRRHAVSRRGRRTAAGRAGEAAARDPGGTGRSGRRKEAGEGRRAHHLGDQPQPDRGRDERTLPRRPVSTARTCSRSRCRRCASGPRTSRNWCGTSSCGSPRRKESASARSRPTRSGCSTRILGPATCANSRTRSSVPSCWPTATRSARPNSRSSATACAHGRARDRAAPDETPHERAAAPMILDEPPPPAAAPAVAATRWRLSMPPATSVRWRRSRPNDSFRDRALSRADVGSRAPVAHRALDALPQARRDRARYGESSEASKKTWPASDTSGEIRVCDPPDTLRQLIS